jgi:hypothetical protein
MLIVRRLYFFILLNIGCRKINTAWEEGYVELSMDNSANGRDSGPCTGLLRPAALKKSNGSSAGLSGGMNAAHGYSGWRSG